MAVPRVIQQFIKDTRRLDTINAGDDLTTSHNQLIIANSGLLANLPAPVDGTEIFFKFNTPDSVHVIAPVNTNIDGFGQIVSNATGQSMRLVAADGVWLRASQFGNQFDNLDRPTYTLSNFNAPTEAEYGEDVTGSADVLNEGDLGNDLVELKVGESTISSQNIRLDFNESTNVSLTGTITQQPGLYQISIETPSASISQGFEVLTPATLISISDLTAPIDASRGDTIDVTVTVENEGESVTDTPIQLYVNRGQSSERLVEEKLVDLDFLESKELTYTFEILSTSDSIEVEVDTGDATQARQIQLN